MRRGAMQNAMQTGRMRNLYSLWMEKSEREKKTQTKSQRQINLST